METYTELKELAENLHYRIQRRECLYSLTDDMIDMPIIKIIKGFNKVPYCFTLQSCHGHFVYSGQKDPHNIEPLPVTDTITEVEYRVAYIAVCIENSASGRETIKSLKEITNIDPKNIQFCCAEWFWTRQINSYVLQVEPDRFKHKDQAILDYKEAVYIEKVRNDFFDQLDKLLVNVKKESERITM